ncbi:hypothetical protein [Vibrio sp. WXL103]|uniref:hypothetical protein n=1 Tax=Vibrio sp. WXL103 TaxID=3450710 RepID=UPI003EC57231
MGLKQLNSFSFDQVERSNNARPRMRIINTTTKESTYITGAYLEAQYATRDGYLLFITEDCPFEETLYIFYLRHDLLIQDCIELSTPYSPGILNVIDDENEDFVQFSFFTPEERWQLAILSKPSFGALKLAYPAKRYPFSRRLGLKGRAMMSLKQLGTVRLQ